MHYVLGVDNEHEEDRGDEDLRWLGTNESN